MPLAISRAAGPRFLNGRRPSLDVRDWRFPMRRATKGLGCGGSVVVPIVGKTWEAGPLLDQGMTPQCVAFAWAGWLGCLPLRTLVPSPSFEDALYHRAQQLDEWPGEDYDGTSVRGGAKALAELGHIKDYTWAALEQELWNYIASTGPVVIGVNWYDGMMDPDSNGYLNLTGYVAGGHSTFLRGAGTDYLMRNSWGRWGLNGDGDALIRRPDMARLLGEDGEACTGSEILVAA
jgi:hypothetical protein